MIPLAMTLAVRKCNGRGVRLWLPLFLLWLVVLPFLVLLSPVYFVGCAVARVNPLIGMYTVWAIASAAAGTHVEVTTPRAQVFLHLY